MMFDVDWSGHLLNVLGSFRSGDDGDEQLIADEMERLGYEAVPALITILSGNHPRLRVAAAWALGTLGHDASEAVPALLKAMRDPDPKVRAEATEALKKCSWYDDQIAPLVEAVGDCDANVRVSAAFGLAALAVPTATNALLQALRDPESAVRETAAGALAGSATYEAGDREIVLALGRALADDSAGVRVSAAWALGKYGHGAHAASSALARAMEDSDLATRVEAANAWVQIGLDAERGVSVLVKCIESSDPDVRSRAVEVMEDLKEAVIPAIPTYLRFLRGPDDNLRAVGAYLTGRAGPSARAAKSALAPALKHPEPGIRLWAAEAWVRVGLDARRAIPVLLEGLDNADDEVRVHAAWTLERLAANVLRASPRKSLLSEALQDSHPQVRLSIATVCSTIGHEVPKSVEVLVGALAEADEGIRSDAARALGNLGPLARSAVPALVRVLRDPIDRVRYNAASALERIEPDPAHVASLVELLDEPAGIRARAVRVLKRMGLGARAAAPKLVEGLRSALTLARRESAYALRDISDPEAETALVQALKDPDGEVRRAASEAIGRIGLIANATLSSVVRVLTKVRDSDPSEVVRISASLQLSALQPQTALDPPAILARAGSTPDSVAGLSSLALDHKDLFDKGRSLHIFYLIGVICRDEGIDTFATAHVKEQLFCRFKVERSLSSIGNDLDYVEKVFRKHFADADMDLFDRGQGQRCTVLPPAWKAFQIVARMFGEVRLKD
jgi:HEAT repeat protein